MEQINSVERGRASLLHHGLISYGNFLLNHKFPDHNFSGFENFQNACVVAVSPHYREGQFMELVYLASALRNNEHNLNAQCAIAVKPTQMQWLSKIVKLLGDEPLVAASSKRKGMKDSTRRREFNNEHFYKPGISLAQTMPVLLYPQGQRLSREELLTEKGLRFHPGAAEIAQRAGVPLLSAIVWGENKTLTIDIREVDLSETIVNSVNNRNMYIAATEMIKAHYADVMQDLL